VLLQARKQGVGGVSWWPYGNDGVVLDKRATKGLLLQLRLNASAKAVHEARIATQARNQSAITIHMHAKA
jgi:hypothetical protein